MVTETLPVAWIIEPIKEGTVPYMTLKPEVADKRKKAGDIVTPYVSKKPLPDSEDEEL